MAGDPQAVQLEAFRRLFSNNEFLNGLLAQGMGEIGLPKDPVTAPPASAPKISSGAIKKNVKSSKRVSNSAKSKTPGSKSGEKRSGSRSLTTARVAKSSFGTGRGKSVNRRADTLSGENDEEEEEEEEDEDDLSQDVATPVGFKPVARSRYPPRERVQVSQTQYLDSDFEPMNIDKGQGLKQFIIGLDYGTTFTSVSYYSYPENEDSPRALPSDVKSIVNWPADGMSGMRRQIPTESWYSAIPKARVRPADQFELGDSDDEDPVTRQVSGSTSVAVRSHIVQDDSEEDGDGSTRYLWGYEVPYQRYRANTTRDEIRRIERPKLMLVTTPHTKKDRQRLRPRLDHLIERGIIQKYGRRDIPNTRDVQDAISDFLVEVLHHTKQELIGREGLTTETKVSFVLTVPVIWSPSSSRVLQSALEAAIRETGFGTLGHGSAEDLFIIAEPEAAATYLLGNSHDMIAGETFVVLDCGGGTVDAVAYAVANSYPLHLKREVERPTGDNCGASYLNDNFEKRLLERLADEKYLDRKGETRNSIVRHLVPDFEDFDKRTKDIAKMPRSRIHISGLVGDEDGGITKIGPKRFSNNYLHMNSDDYNAIFLPLLHRVRDVLRGQLDMAISKQIAVKKVFLIGGFGAAPSLRSFLSDFLKDFTRGLKLPYEIRLITTNEQESVTAVASGAVLRALNKQQGPSRQAYSSFGFLRTEPYLPDDFEGHLLATPMRDEVDGGDYVTVIDYFMVKGTVIPPMHTYLPFKTYHTFEIDNPRLLCEEVLYVSDKATESHFSLHDPRNEDAQVAGRIIVDMTFLRDEQKIFPVFPAANDVGVNQGKLHYKVEYDLFAVVEGRNLRYEARYPANESGKVQKTGQISIAAAFRPGTG